MTLITSTIARGLRCPVCGAAHATCGEPSATVGVDERVTVATDRGPVEPDPEQGIAELRAAQDAARTARREAAGMAMVKVDRGDGVLFKFNAADARAYLKAHPDAKRLPSERAAEDDADDDEEEDAPAAKAVRTEDVEDKAVRGPRARQRAERD